jgi:hypothetical protein
MLCESCAQGLQHCRDEELRAALLARHARASELRKMPWGEYRMTPQWRSRQNRVLLRAGNRCEVCYGRGRLDVHHCTYERYGEEPRRPDRVVPLLPAALPRHPAGRRVASIEAP